MKLCCEYMKDPLGIDTSQPRFSWVPNVTRRGQIQTAYRILVASSEESLEVGCGDKWDSGKAESGQSVNIVYNGAPLASGERCYWKVRIWNGDDEGVESTTAWFEMGLLLESDWHGDWIGSHPTVSAPLLRKSFVVDDPIKRARAYVCGLGWHEFYINGQQLGDHALDAAPTDYDRRALYVTYDVTDRLRQGDNGMGVILGNGWYSAPSTPRYGDSPRLLLQLNIETRNHAHMTVATDSTWKIGRGPIVHNDLFGGERYDARLEQPGWTTTEFDDDQWDFAAIKSSPGGRLESQTLPPIKAGKTIAPRTVTSPKSGVYVFDFGQLFGGWARIHLKGPKGATVTLRYSARICPRTGLIDQSHYTRHHQFRSSSPEPNEVDIYTLKGDAQGETYTPRFTFHPVRYVQVEGFPGTPTAENLEGVVVHSDFDLCARFHCSNPLFNQIHDNVGRTLTNALYGMPMDCLHREPWAWIDPGTVASLLSCRQHMPQFWTKWLDDIRNAQDDKGRVPDIVPRYYVKDVSDPAWGGNYPILVWYLYQYYDDIRLLEDNYPGLKRWLAYLTSISTNHLVEKGNWGDHMLPGTSPGEEEMISSQTPPPLVWTGYYYRAAAVTAQVADRLGHCDDAAQYSRLAGSICEAFNRRWLDTHRHQYASGSQTANALPLALGIVPDEHKGGVIESIINDIMQNHRGHFYTGNIGTPCMIDALAAHGYERVIYRVANATDYPGWGYMVNQGATTIWEHWGLAHGEDSMMMFGSIEEFFFNTLAGISGPTCFGPAAMAPGFRQIRIRPCVVDDLRHAEASIRSVRGMIASSWRKAEDSISLKVTIPANSRADVSVPKIGLDEVSITEGDTTVFADGRYIHGAEGVANAREMKEYVTFAVGSGNYHFRLTGPHSDQRAPYATDRPTADIQ